MRVRGHRVGRRFRRSYLDWTDEFVSLLRQRSHVSRRGGIVAERGSDLTDAEIQSAIEVHEGVVGPDGAAQLLARHRPARALEQRGEHVRGLRLQMDRPPLARQLEARRVEEKHAETVSGRRAQYGTYP